MLLRLIVERRPSTTERPTALCKLPAGSGTSPQTSCAGSSAHAAPRLKLSLQAQAGETMVTLPLLSAVHPFFFIAAKQKVQVLLL